MNGLAETGATDRLPLTVLVVDADTRALGLTASHIEHRVAGATVMRAQSHAEALIAVVYGKTDFIVFDCQGSRSAWNQFLNELFRLCPDVKVVLTGRAPVPVRGESNILGFFQKPYQIDDLIALIESKRRPGVGGEAHTEDSLEKGAQLSLYSHST